MSYDTLGQRKLPVIETPAAVRETMMTQAVELAQESAVVKKAGRPKRLSNRLLAAGILWCRLAWLGLAMGSVATRQLLWRGCAGTCGGL